MVTPVYAQNCQNSTKSRGAHGPLALPKRSLRSHGSRTKRAKVRQKRRARQNHVLENGLFQPPLLSLRAWANAGAQARAHRSHEPCASAGSSSTGTGSQAADVVVRAVRGGGASAARLDDVDGHGEEVDPPLGGDSARLGLEPSAHRQLAATGSRGGPHSHQEEMCSG